MNRVELTSRYLDEVRRRGTPAHELVSAQSKSEGFQDFYGARYLSRPLFLGHEEKEQLYQDVEIMRQALVSLPDRLYGGDLAAFARAVGMADVQVSAITRSRGATMQSRADMYTDESGFKVLEFNMGSALGGIDQSDMARAMLAQPVLAEFAATHELTYVDTMREQLNNMFAEGGFAPDAKPVLVTTDSPSSYTTLESFIIHFDARLRELGVEAYGAHVGQLEVRDGGVWYGDHRIDIIQRLFMIEDLVQDPDLAAMLDPILDAAARGEVSIFTPMDAEMYASKGALAMLSDEANRSLFEPKELASLDRILPWTRMVRPGPVTTEDGRVVDLLEYALANRHDLALKPTLLHGGQGVLLGWRDETTDELWAERIRAALDGPFVIQRRIRPVPELFPTDNGEPAPWIITWGMFTMGCGYGGVFARGASVESNIEVINLGTGAFSGCCLHALPGNGNPHPVGTAGS